MDGMFNFLIGAIDIPNISTGYNVYASVIALNGFALPATFKAHRDGYSALIVLSRVDIRAPECDAGTVAKGGDL